MSTLRQNAIRVGLAVWLCLLSVSGIAFAQSDATPIQIGQNAFGELTAEANSARYALTAAGSESATIQVLALSPNFAPRFRIINPAGVEILVVANPDGLNALTGSASLPDAGEYIIEITGENGTVGQFVLSLQPGASLPEPVELAVDQPISDMVGGDTPVHVYRFSTTEAANTLTILSESDGAGVLVSLFDEAIGKTIASHDAGVSDVAYRLPSEERNYRVEVRAGGTDDTAFSICLGNCGGLLSSETSTQPPVVETVETPEVVPTTCTVASGTGGSINVRSGPGPQYAVVGNLAAGQSFPVLGQLAGSGWYEVSFNGQIGWIAASVTRLQGDCTTLPTVAAPAGAQLAPTQPPPQPTQPSGGSAPPIAPTAQGPLPDLLIELSSASVQATFVQALFVIDNKGTVISGPFSISICANDTCITETVSSINPSDPKFFTRQINYVANAPVTIRVTVDSGNQVTESDEGNNVVTAMREPPMPDLTVTIDSFFVDTSGYANIRYSISNIGSASATSPFTITLCVDLTCTSYDITSSLSPGETWHGGPTTMTFEADPLAVSPRATATIDSAGNIAESNESNNGATAYPS